MTGLDAVGIGTPTLDELLLLPSYPDEQVESAIRMAGYAVDGGGPAATAMVAAARLGWRTGYVANVGDDERGRRILEGLRAAGVDASTVVVQPGGRSTLSVVCIHAPTGRRSFLLDSDPELRLGPRELPRDYIASARILLVESFAPTALAAAALARKAGRKVVVDASAMPAEQSRVSGLFSLTDVVIASARFAREFLGRDDPSAAAEAIRAAGAPVAVVTAGADGAFLSAAGEAFHQPAFAVEVVDTTGAGDVFHGAFIAAMLEGLPPRTATAWAAGAAALSCRRLGGRAGIPDRRELVEFLRRHGQAA